MFGVGIFKMGDFGKIIPIDLIPFDTYEEAMTFYMNNKAEYRKEGKLMAIGTKRED